jgi:hypothetical protein
VYTKKGFLSFIFIVVVVLLGSWMNLIFQSSSLARAAQSTRSDISDGFQVCQNTNYGQPCETFTYTSHDTCISLDQMAGHNKSVEYLGSYIGGYSAVMYHDTNCQTYLARYDSNNPDIGWGLYDQFSSMRLEQHIPPTPSPTPQPTRQPQPTQQPTSQPTHPTRTDYVTACTGTNYTSSCDRFGVGQYPTLSKTYISFWIPCDLTLDLYTGNNADGNRGVFNANIPDLSQIWNSNIVHSLQVEARTDCTPDPGSLNPPTSDPTNNGPTKTDGPTENPPNGGKPPQPVPPDSHKLFVFVLGISSSWDSGYEDFETIHQALLKQYPAGTTDFLMFSYNGSSSNGSPNSYRCYQTFDHHLADYVSMLEDQINKYLANHPDITSVGVFGHSMGGVVTYGLLADVVLGLYNLPNNSRLDEIATLDSPLDGVPGGIGGLYYQIAWGYYKSKPGCEELNQASFDPKSLKDLNGLYQNPPFGDFGDIAGLLRGESISNQQVALTAANLGISILTFGNLLDYTFDWSQCPVIAGISAPVNFINTQLLTDEGLGSGIYSRSFSKGSACHDASKDLGINHGLVFTNSFVVSELVYFAAYGNPL